MADRGLIGRELGTVRFPVERGKLAELARSFDAPEPLWSDREAAREAGFDDIPAPPTATVVADLWREHGALDGAIRLGLDTTNLLHGEASWQFFAPVRCGDELTARSSVVDVNERVGKRGGAMTLVAIETSYTNQHGEQVATRRDVVVEKGGNSSAR
ncbi:MaoC dehydratase-like protein [Tamaricihabitans halophyticus]|uniref:MaoC dehydratase-like protein n=1 Tax=Tamaricihabitans halophyticus TaxID=1262583 RepID=A0A4R2Q2G1_9PSEU|nr:MaoC family dehydratase N-terminal domain-containing protein [Tamaricihabitans halophyticus]TCP42609.1 MaoC dehydratase-like protein [Tamaricihabitans halophyticus]